MRHDQRGASLHQPLQGFLYQPLRFGIECRRGFVQQQDGRVLVKRPRNRQTLPLAAGQLGGVVAQHGVDALRQALHVRAQIGSCDALLDARAVHIGAERHVGCERVVEHHDVLAHHGELGAQAGQAPLRDVVAVQQDLAAAGQYEPGQQVDQRGLARARRANEGHDFTRRDDQVDAVQRPCFVGAAVVDAHLAQFDATRCTGQVEAALRFRGCVVHQRQAALQCSQAARDRVGNIGQPANGRNQHQHRRDVGDKATDRQALFAALPERNHHDHRQRDSRQQLRERRHGGGCDCRLDGQAIQAVTQLVEAQCLRRFGPVQPHHAMCQHVFFHDVGQVVGGFLAKSREVVQALGQHLHDPRHAGHQQRNDHRELPVQVQQIEQQRDHREPIARQAEQCLHQQHRASLHFIDHGVRQGAGRLPRKQRQLSRQQSLEQHAAQALHAFVGNTGQRVLRYELGHAAHQEQRDDRDRNHP